MQKLGSHLVLPAVYLVMVLLSIIIFSFRVDIQWDPLFTALQRGELIYFAENISGNAHHPYWYYPLHLPILYSWALFFDFNFLRVFLVMALIGLVAITFQNVRTYSHSPLAALFCVILIVVFQRIYTEEAWAIGLSNVYCFLGLMYGWRYLEREKVSFLLLGSFFLVMYANTRPAGVLYWGMMFVLLALLCLKKGKLRIWHGVYYVLPYVGFYFIPHTSWQNVTALLAIIGVSLVMRKYWIELEGIWKRRKGWICCFGGLAMLLALFVGFPEVKETARLGIMWMKISAKFFLDVLESWGTIYKDESLKHFYHANNVSALVLSFFAFWDSLFFDPEKVQFFNMLNVVGNLVKRLPLQIWIILLVIGWKEILEPQFVQRTVLFLVIPFVSLMVVLNAIHIIFYFNMASILNTIDSDLLKRSGNLVICLIFFIFTSELVGKAFRRIEEKKILAYALNIPFIWLLAQAVLI